MGFGGMGGVVVATMTSSMLTAHTRGVRLGAGALDAIFGCGVDQSTNDDVGAFHSLAFAEVEEAGSRPTLEFPVEHDACAAAGRRRPNP